MCTGWHASCYVCAGAPMRAPMQVHGRAPWMGGTRPQYISICLYTNYLPIIVWVKPTCRPIIDLNQLSNCFKFFAIWVYRKLRCEQLLLFLFRFLIVTRSITYVTGNSRLISLYFLVQEISQWNRNTWVVSQKFRCSRYADNNAACIIIFYYQRYRWKLIGHVIHYY